MRSRTLTANDHKLMVRNQRSQLRLRQQRDSYLRKVKNEKVETESIDLQRHAEQSQSQVESRQKKSSKCKSSATENFKFGCRF